MLNAKQTASASPICWREPAAGATASDGANLRLLFELTQRALDGPLARAERTRERRCRPRLAALEQGEDGASVSVDRRSQHDDGGGVDRGKRDAARVASMRASGRGARWRDRCLQLATHRSPIGQVVRREAGRQVLLFSRDDHERHQRHRWHEGDE